MITELLSWLNVAAVVSTIIFCVCVEKIVSEQYIYRLFLLAISIFSALPFIINFLILRKIILTSQKIRIIIFFILSALLFVNTFCLYVMYMNQLGSIIEFGLEQAAEVYFCIFLPLWIIFFIILTCYMQSKPAKGN